MTVYIYITQRMVVRSEVAQPKAVVTTQRMIAIKVVNVYFYCRVPRLLHAADNLQPHQEAVLVQL